MATIPQTLLKLMLCLLAVGCVSTTPWMVKREPAPCGIPSQVIVTWEPRVLVTADSAGGGAPLPGIAGRLYLFGNECGYPMAHDGTLHVELYDVGPVANGGQPAFLEYWDIDAQKLKMLLRKDIVGWGYTVFLPWGSYAPTVTQVQMKLCFMTTQGIPLYAPSSPMKLQDSNFPPPVVTSTTQVAGPPVAAVPQGPPTTSIQLLPPGQ